MTKKNLRTFVKKIDSMLNKQILLLIQFQNLLERQTFILESEGLQGFAANRHETEKMFEIIAGHNADIMGFKNTWLTLKKPIPNDIRESIAHKIEKLNYITNDILKIKQKYYLNVLNKV